ncbi:MAG: hypothetical protein QXW35_03810 [Candidatus Aenigmatarchaeota archaeon]
MVEIEIQNQKGQGKLKIASSEIGGNLCEMTEAETIKTIMSVIDKVVEYAKMQKIISFRLDYDKRFDVLPGLEDMEEELYFEITDNSGKETGISFIKINESNITFKKIFKEIVKKYYRKLKHIALMNAIKEYNQKYNKNVSIKDIKLDKRGLMIIKPFRAEIGSKYSMTLGNGYKMGFFLILQRFF